MVNTNCLISIELDDRIFNCVYYYLGELVNDEKKAEMLELFNEFNHENVMLNFYVDKSNSMMVRYSYIVENDHFDGHEFLSLLIPAFKSIEENYFSRIMRTMWC